MASLSDWMGATAGLGAWPDWLPGSATAYAKGLELIEGSDLLFLLTIKHFLSTNYSQVGYYSIVFLPFYVGK